MLPRLLVSFRSQCWIYTWKPPKKICARSRVTGECLAAVALRKFVKAVVCSLHCTALVLEFPRRNSPIVISFAECLVCLRTATPRVVLLPAQLPYSYAELSWDRPYLHKHLIWIINVVDTRSNQSLSPLYLRRKCRNALTSSMWKWDVLKCVDRSRSRDFDQFR